ncbi:hypothetical protein QMK17_17540 [Rhodococcus sp. G-MC3]|uniref:hypothetical protein n=1 Tax=Rhodococcus sp. G-MC3 TaxID=3046209 RepID=UPI0024B900EB|nr:hypothetical protein [Rhodococcus sp. G-MC3]MDJ0395131.1 hypothetical protein [Rhodococcus sp. G-MC3]
MKNPDPGAPTAEETSTDRTVPLLSNPTVFTALMVLGVVALIVFVAALVVR